VLLLCIMALVPAAAQEASAYYTEPQLYGMRPNPNAETPLGPIGATGIEARIYKGVRVIVENTQPNTPARGKFSKGDVILGVNGAKLEGKNPLVVLGTALTEAEANPNRSPSRSRCWAHTARPSR
jgi:C-terminal processing protease CtpA/Prc